MPKGKSSSLSSATDISINETGKLSKFSNTKKTTQRGISQFLKSESSIGDPITNLPSSNETLIPKPITEGKVEKPKSIGGKLIHSGNSVVQPSFPDTKFGDFGYYPLFLNKEEQADIQKHLDEIPWQRVTYPKFGKERRTPRKTFCFGTPLPDGKGTKVSWRGNQFMTEDMPDWLKQLRSRIEEKTGKKFNACIMNNYEREEDHISWHQDDERFLFHNTVASISLGSVRNFKVKIGPNKEVHEIPLQLGSLGVLINGVEHCLPPRTAKEKRADFVPRFNITFRNLKTDDCGISTKTGVKACGFGNYYMYCRGQNYQINKKTKEEETEEQEEEGENSKSMS